METAVLHLASEINEFYYRLVQQRFEDIQTAHQRMSAYIEERLAEMRSEIQRGLGHIEEKVDVKIRNLRAEFHFQICHLDELVSNDEDNNERSKAIVELTATIENVPSTWNENQIVDNIAEGAANKGVATDDFQVVSAKQECIVLELRAPLSVFKDNETLQNALKTLLERIIRAGEIDDSVPSEVKIKITNRAISEPTFAAGPFANDEDAVDLSTINLPRIHFLLSIVLDIFPDILREWIAQDILTQKVETPIPLFELDLEGLYTEIKSAELNGARVSGSDSMAFATDTQIAADIDRMVYIQKQVCKRPNSVVSDEEWNDHLKDIFDIVNRFDKLMHKEKDSCYNRQTADLLISWTLAMQCSDGDSQDSYQMQLSNVNPQEIHWTNIEHWGEADKRESFVGPLTNRTVSYSKGESSFVKSPLDNKKFNTAGSEYSVDSGLGSDEVKQKDKVSQEGDLKLSAIYSDKEKLLGRHMIKHRRSRKIVAIVDTYAKRKLFSAPAALSTVFSENPCYEANTTVQQTDKSEQNIGETVGDRKEPNEDLEVTHF